MRKLIPLAMLLIVLCAVQSYCQSPALLNSSITYDSNPNMNGNQKDYLNVNDIENAFNNARRVEESQFCLPINSISNLNMPNQTAWNNMNSDERFLFLTNAERMSRIGLDYCQGEGTVSGVAFTGVESNIDNIAQEHAEYLIANQSVDEMSQSTNIDANPNIGGTGCDAFDCCHTFVLYSVYRIYYTSMDTPSNPSTITTEGIEAQSVYHCVYGSGALGNGRRMLLLQDMETGGNSSNPYGFYDDYGDMGNEGFLGLGIAGGVPHPSFDRTHIDMVIISYFDPIPQSFGCNYDCTTCDPCPQNLTQNSNALPSGTYQASNTITSAALIPNSNDVNMNAGDFVELSPSFEVLSGGTYEAIIDGCYFNLN